MEECCKLIAGVITKGKEKVIPSRGFFGTNSGQRKTIPKSKTVLDKMRIKCKSFKTYKKYQTKENYKA